MDQLQERLGTSVPPTQWLWDALCARASLSIVTLHLHHRAHPTVVHPPLHPLVSTGDNPKSGSCWQGGLCAGTIGLPSSVTSPIPHPCPARVNPAEAGCLRALVPVQK